MKRFLFLSSAIFCSILLGQLFAVSSASAASPYDSVIRNTDQLYIGNDNVTDNFEGEILSRCGTLAYTQYQVAKGAGTLSIIQVGLDNPNFPGVSQFRIIQIVTAPLPTTTPAEFSSYGNGLTLNATVNNPTVMYLRPDNGGDCLIDTYDSEPFVYQLADYQYTYSDNFYRPFYSNIPVNYPPDYDGPVIPSSAGRLIKLPLFATGVPNKTPPNTGNIKAQYVKDKFQKDYPGVPIPDYLIMSLQDSEFNLIEGISGFTPKGFNSWDNLPYGNYRISLVGFYDDDDINDEYKVVTTIIDVRLDDRGFVYDYDPNEKKYCFYESQYTTDATLWSLNNDPNTGSWISPGSVAKRCNVEQPGDKDSDDDITVDYDFDVLEQCQTFDLVCVASRFFNSITAWIMNAIYNLFIPNPAFWSNQPAP